jgi:Predicted integral membrane protein (DUF2269)
MLYQWIVYVHILAVFAFLLAHGTATAITFKLRGERKIERIRALLDLSQSMSILGRVSLLVLLLAGIILGFMGQWWGHGWIWAALILLVLMGVAMSLLASRPLLQARRLLAANSAAEVDQQVSTLLAAPNPVVLSVIGGLGIAIILWLMQFKPF